MISRRDFLEQSAFAFAGATSLGRLASHDREVVGAPLGRLNVRAPDAVAVQTANEMRQLRAVGAGRWEGAGVTVSTVDAGDALRVQIASPLSRSRSARRSIGSAQRGRRVGGL